MKWPRSVYLDTEVIVYSVNCLKEAVSRTEKLNMLNNHKLNKTVTQHKKGKESGGKNPHL